MKHKWTLLMKYDLHSRNDSTLSRKRNTRVRAPNSNKDIFVNIFIFVFKFGRNYLLYSG